MDPSEEFAQTERLRQVVIGSGLQPHDHIDFLIARGQYDHHRSWLARPQRPTHINAVNVRQTQIKENT